MELIIFLILGGALTLAFLYTLTFRQLSGNEDSEAMADLVKILALPAVQFKAAAQVLDARDHEALQSSFLNELARQLRRDRRQIALQWLRQLQTEVSTLWRFRRLVARYDVSVSAEEEFHVTMSMLGVLIYLMMLRSAVALAGPWPLAGLLSHVQSPVVGISRSCAQLLGRIPTSKRGDIQRQWAALLATEASY